MATQTFTTSFLLILTGAFAGAIGTIILRYIDSRRERIHRAKSLTAAFYGEVSSIIEIIAGLDLVNDVKRSLEKLVSTGIVTDLGLSVNEQYFNIYKNNLSNLGLLDPKLVRTICIFYTYGIATIEYLNELSTPEWANNTSPEEAKESIERLLKLIERHRVEGEKLIPKLKNIQ